ncbi:hypothetical protein ATI61_1307 [Archangium gephyra]|uniref:Uncharacterized protein n=1 Tax=Archangium gephyra TaxID=48 RepID=A0AAC8QIX7_9BACT|nr:hypothetical protein [Archangium gephyra]AKJ08423.1 Hypothetical protein AA314_10049 [Archangium gephyra]REG14252.1 hypothetical protein ATI61_1307 [Archangium gephyra]
MLATLLVLSVLQLSPADAPRLDVEPPRALSLLSPSVAVAHDYGLLSHEHQPGRPVRRSSFSFLRAFGEFVTGFGSQLVVGSGLWAVEVVTLFGATVLSSAFTGGEGTDFVLGAGTHAMILFNGAVLPLLSTLPIWLIASTDLGYSHSFIWTWLSGIATYAAFWSLQYSLPSRHGGLELILWPTHVASWFFVALVQTVVINLTKERSSFASRAPAGALLNVDGTRLSVGAPLPVFAPDVSRPGRVVTVLSLAQGRF